MPINETIVLVSCVVYIIGIGVCSYYFHSSNDTNRCCKRKNIENIQHQEYCEI